ncbi:MAG: ABC transporter ATP-binding protein/permease [Caldisericaceae bacterium]
MINTAYKRFVPYFLKYKIMLIITFLSTIIASITSAIIPLYLKSIVDTLISKKDFSHIKLSFIIFVSLVFANIVFKLLQIYIGNLTGQKIMRDIRLDMFGRVSRFRLQSFTKEPTGKIITRITNDIENMNELLNAGIVSLLADLLFVLLAIIFIFYINFKLALIILSPLPIALFLSLYLGNIIEKIYERVRDSVTKMNIHMQEILTGLNVVQLFNLEQSMIDKFRIFSKDFRNNFYKSQVINVFLRQVINISSYISIFLLIFIGGKFTINGTSTIGTIIAFSTYLSYLYGPLGDLSDKFSILQNAIASMVKIDGFLNDNPEEDFYDEGIKFDVKGSVALEDVYFSYDEGNEVLKGINMLVNQGEKIALVGFTGAGKTTIANLIFNFYEPTKGEINIDGISLKNVCKTNYRKYLGMVLQNVFIFKGNIIENITLGDDYSIEEVERVCKILGIFDYIKKLPLGFYYELSTEGKNISMGERQLISFARALIHNPRILILDEATSSVDTRTEELLEKGTKILIEDRTSIVIAHRLSTIRNVDKIYVINKGRIVEFGSHEELMEKKGLYYEFYKSQYR